MFTHDRRVGHRMKKIFPKRRIAMNKEQIALLAAAVILPGGVLAADLPAKAPGYMPAAAYGWSGSALARMAAMVREQTGSPTTLPKSQAHS
jgi:hypothetical protein